MKVKFANRIYEVLFTKELAGLTIYAVEDEPNHIDWLINVEVIDVEKKELKNIENEINLPFGAKDSEFLGANYCIPEGFHAEIKGNRVFIKKGEQKPAWSEEDERMLSCAEEAVKAYFSEIGNEGSVIHWIESLKDRVQPQKQEWSKEDDKMIDSIAVHLNATTSGFPEERAWADRFMNWLKSLKDRVQPKSDWGEEDEKISKAIIKRINGESDYLSVDLSSAICWIKNVKDRVQPQQDWSEEDAKALNRISAILVDASEVKNWWKEYRLIERDEMIRLIDFLKSLRPQNRWKPDKTTLDTLQLIIYHPYSMSDYQQEILINLLGQLEKLTE